VPANRNSMCALVQKVSRPRDGELGRPLESESIVCPSRTGRNPSRHGCMSTPLSQNPGSAAVMATSTGPVASKLTHS